MSISNVDELYEKTSDVINQLILLTKSTKYDDETFNKSLQLFFDISNSIKASIDITSYHIKVAINILSKPSIIRNLINIYRELGRKAIPLSFTPVINSQSLSNPLPDMKWIFTFINFQQILTTYISVSISFTQIIMKSDIYLTEVRRILNRSINIELFENIDSLIESIIFGLNTSLFYEDEIIRTRVIDYCLHNILMHYIHSKNWRIQMNTAHFLVFITYTDISQLHINEIEVVIESLMKYFISLINEGIKDDEFNYIRQFNKVLRILALNSKYRIILIVNGVVNYLNLLEKILPNNEEEIFLTLRIISSEISTDNAVEEINLLAKKNYDKITSLEEELRVVSSDVCNDAEDEDDNISPPVDTGGETNYTVEDEKLSPQTDEKNPCQPNNGHIMISYSHADAIIAHRIARRLQRKNIKIWIDKDHMVKEVDTYEGMAKAVQDSSIVCILFSKSYQNGDNPKAECEYARLRKKHLIFLRVERDFRPTGWLGLILGSRKYIDFSGKYPFEKVFNELCTTIEQLAGLPIPVEPKREKGCYNYFM